MAAGGRRLRVAFLTSAGTWRGSVVSMALVVHGLRARGHDACMFISDAGVADHARRLGIAVHAIEVTRTDARAVWRLRRLLRSCRVDVLVTDRPRDLRLAGFATLVSRTRLVNRFNLSRRDPPRDLSSRLACRRSSCTVFTSEHFARLALAKARFMAAVPWRVIGAAIDPAAFTQDPEAGRRFRARHGLGDAPFLLAAGALVPEKRYDVILQALALLGDAAAPLVVCGEGMHARALQAQAARLGVPVQWLGLVSPEEMLGAYNAATLLVHACPIETFGRSVAEALCCGTPVVAVRGGAVPEVAGDAALLVPPGDARVLAGAIRELLRHPDERARLADAGHRRAREAWSLDAVVDAWERVVTDVGAR